MEYLLNIWHILEIINLFVEQPLTAASFTKAVRYSISHVAVPTPPSLLSFSSPNLCYLNQ